MSEGKPGESYLAGFDLYSAMAHFVGRLLHIRPGEILDTWSVAELIVAFGEYSNEIADKNYKEWQHMDIKSRSKIDRPPKFFVQFIDIKDLEDG